jgi:hypothetical protein
MAADSRFLDGKNARMKIWKKIRARVLEERAFVAVTWWAKGCPSCSR